MMTLMPVAAFAAENTNAVANSNSVAYTEDTDIDVATETATFDLRVLDKFGADTITTNLYVWVTKDGSNVPVETADVQKAVNEDGVVITEFTSAAVTGAKNVTALTGKFTTKDAFAIKFYSTGTFRVHVSAEKPEMTSGAISNAAEFNYADNKVTVTTTTVKASDMGILVDMDNDFKVYVNGDTEKEKVDNANVGKEGYDKIEADTYDESVLAEDGDVVSALEIAANNVDEEEVTIELINAKTGKPQTGKTLKISSVGAINTSKESVVTNALGQAKFTVSGNAEGTYKVYVTYGSFEATIEVVVGAVGANTIKCVDEPENPIDILSEDLSNGIDAIEFEMYDVNGNKLDPSKVTEGWTKAAESDSDKEYYGYVAIVDQPAGSKLENKNLAFDGETVTSTKAITVEGTYTFKVVLNNGNYATATIEVKEFQTPVELVVEYPEAAELGATVTLGDLYWLDANKVEKDATGKVDLAATGYAVANFDASSGELKIKTDEKYVGSDITITAVDDRYNLVATTVITVADEAKDLKFATKTAEVNVNNKIRVNIVDANGKTVVLGKDATKQNASAVISYVILDKPEDAKVFASTVKDAVEEDGYFDMNLTSNKIGNVTVQAVLKYSYEEKNDGDKNNVVKYYTGTQIFAVGNGSVGDVVVMSIGSNEIIVNDAKATIDAAPMVQNDRTYVPFRALAEAFGAEVAYDEATQAVTAELNGVTVVMTIGSATYTVNGEEKTMDVAPFINGSRTMVPVRFAAEAFGIKVIPTYDENGATADILFNL